jgi:hypothetical protein
MAPPRSGEQRKIDTLAKLGEAGADVWVATARAGGKEFLVPLSYAWDGRHVILSTLPEFLTARDIVASGRARLGFGPTRDVVIIDVVLDGQLDIRAAPPDLADLYARQSGWDPRDEPDSYVLLLMRPVRVQAWREANELEGKWLMREGDWLF